MYDRAYMGSAIGGEVAAKMAAAQQNAIDAPRASTVAERFRLSLSRNNEALSGIAYRLDALLERLSGPRPQMAADAQKVQPPISGALSEIEAQLAEQERLVARVGELSSLLEHLA